MLTFVETNKYRNISEHYLSIRYETNSHLLCVYITIITTIHHKGIAKITNNL